MFPYADDIAVFREDKESISEGVKQGPTFYELTGCVIVWNKSGGFWHGTWKSTPAIFERIRWTCSLGEYLGVQLDHYLDATEYWWEETEHVRAKTIKRRGRGLVFKKGGNLLRTRGPNLESTQECGPNARRGVISAREDRY